MIEKIYPLRVVFRNETDVQRFELELSKWFSSTDLGEHYCHDWHLDFTAKINNTKCECVICQHENRASPPYPRLLQ